MYPFTYIHANVCVCTVITVNREREKTTDVMWLIKSVEMVD